MPPASSLVRWADVESEIEYRRVGGARDHHLGVVVCLSPSTRPGRLRGIISGFFICRSPVERPYLLADCGHALCRHQSRHRRDHCGVSGSRPDRYRSSARERSRCVPQMARRELRRPRHLHDTSRGTARGGDSRRRGAHDERDGQDLRRGQGRGDEVRGDHALLRRTRRSDAREREPPDQGLAQRPALRADRRDLCRHALELPVVASRAHGGAHHHGGQRRGL